MANFKLRNGPRQTNDGEVTDFDSDGQGIELTTRSAAPDVVEAELRPAVNQGKVRGRGKTKRDAFRAAANDWLASQLPRVDWKDVEQQLAKLNAV